MSSPSDLSRIRDALRCARSNCPCHRPTGLVHCPYHSPPGNQDRTPNLSLKLEPGGKLLWHCFSNCEQTNVFEALQDLELLERPRGPYDPPPARARARASDEPGDPEPVAEQPVDEDPGDDDDGGDWAEVALYTYRNDAGEILGLKRRLERAGHKRFTWTDADGGQLGRRMEQLSLWAADNDRPAAAVLEARPDDTVYLVEGEKACAAAAKAGLLAVCGPWGAAQPDFGNVLNVLRGRQVWVWPDKDDLGFEYAGNIVRHLRRRGARGQTLVPPDWLGKKDDADDFFADERGTVGALEVRTEFSVEAEDQDTTVITAAADDGGVIEMRYRLVPQATPDSRRMDIVLSIAAEPATSGVPQAPFIGHANLYAGINERETWVRALDAYFGGSKDKGEDWRRLLNEGGHRAEYMLRQRDPAVRLEDIPDPGPLEFVVHGLIPRGATSLMFARGSAGKSTWAKIIAAHVASGRSLLEREVIQMNVLYLDWETDRESFKRDMRRIQIGHGIPPTDTHIVYRYMTTPLADDAPQLREIVRREKIGLVIVDSAMPACGGEPERAGPSTAFFRALRSLGAQSHHVLAHVSYSSLKEGLPTSPYGNPAWENQPRLATLLQRQTEEEADEVVYGFTARKWNIPRPADFAAAINFNGHSGPIICWEEAEEELSKGRLKEFKPMLERLLDHLWERRAVEGSSGVTDSELADVLDVTTGAVRRICNQNPGRIKKVLGTGVARNPARRILIGEGNTLENALDRMAERDNAPAAPSDADAFDEAMHDVQEAMRSGEAVGDPPDAVGDVTGEGLPPSEGDVAIDGV